MIAIIFGTGAVFLLDKSITYFVTFQDLLQTIFSCRFSYRSPVLFVKQHDCFMSHPGDILIGVTITLYLKLVRKRAELLSLAVMSDSRHTSGNLSISVFVERSRSFWDESLGGRDIFNNRCWCKKTRRNDLSWHQDIGSGSFVLSQSTHVINGQTHVQTDKRT